jgi:hypothetical protein
MPGSAPRLSVVVFFGQRRRRALRCLQALAEQTNPPEMEVVGVDLYPAAGRPDVPGLARFRYLPCAEAASISDAKARGARLATGEIIAFLEDHCVPSPGWAAAVAEAFDSHPGAAAAYAFRNLNPVNYTSRAFLVLAYGPWMAPVEVGEIPSPSWMNVAYRAAVLAPHLPELDQHLHCEFLFLRGLKNQGCRFWQSRAEVSHLNHPSVLGSCRDSAVWQRLFAAARVRRERWGWGRRLVYFCGSPLTPLVVAWRLGRRLWERPSMRWPFVKSLPLILTIYGYGMTGEALGYVFGMGRAGRQSIDVETVDPRGEPL